MRADARIGTGVGRHRHAGRVPRARHRQCHRLRHGRHHGQSRRDLRFSCADHGRGADRRLREGAADPDSDDRHFRSRDRRRIDRACGRRRRAACRARKRGRDAGTGLLRPGRTRTDDHRRQSGAGTPQRGEFPRRRDAARQRCRGTRALLAHRRSARHEHHRSRQRHHRHRRDQNVLCGEGGHHGARTRCRGFHAGRLWRRGALARNGGRARAWHRARPDPARAGPFFGLRHAVFGSAL